jgi:hypothetical protein
MKALPPIALLLLSLFVGFGGVDGCNLPLPIVKADYSGAWVVVIEETEDRTPEMSKIMVSDFWSGLKDRELNYAPYDDDSDEAKPYLKHAKTIPWLLILRREDGHVLRSQEMPKTVDELDRVVKGATGR